MYFEILNEKLVINNNKIYREDFAIKYWSSQII